MPFLPKDLFKDEGYERTHHSLLRVQKRMRGESTEEWSDTGAPFGGGLDPSEDTTP